MNEIYLNQSFLQITLPLPTIVYYQDKIAY